MKIPVFPGAEAIGFLKQFCKVAGIVTVSYTHQMCIRDRAYTTYGTSRANAYKILEDSLNLRDVRIYDTIEDADGKERRVLNAKETRCV